MKFHRYDEFLLQQVDETFPHICTTLQPNIKGCQVAVDLRETTRPSQRHRKQCLTNNNTDASHTQLRAVISQGNKPIAFYSRKLNLAQTQYTTTERELLSIVETLNEWVNKLLYIRITESHV